VALCGLACVALLAAAGCSGANQTVAAGSSDTSQSSGAHMAGPAADVHVSQAAVDATPRLWDLTTPESAIRSYLDWTAYAYRVGQSRFASATMTPAEMVRVDSYVQYNIEKQRLIDQKLDSLTLGAASATATSTIIPGTEVWTYSYLSIGEGNPSLGGPYSVTYDTTYTVVRSKDGTWRIDAVKATPRGAVK
jgi:hypothetical protein